jgi:hypothetical protein
MTTSVRLVLEIDGEQFEVFAKTVEHADAPAPVAVPAKRGRGRPAKGEDAPTPAPAQAPAAVEAADPFSAPPAAVTPAVTIEDVRSAMKALAAATSQAIALKVLADGSGGAVNLSELRPEFYSNVVGLATEAMPSAAPAAPAADPFEVPATTPAAKPATLEDIKAACIDAGKRTSQDTVQKIVMKHGGKAKNPDTGLEGPSLKALPATAYAAALAEIKALPSTK